MYCETNPQMADPPTRAPPTASTTIRHSSSQLPYVRKKIDCSRQEQVSAPHKESAWREGEGTHDPSDKVHLAKQRDEDRPGGRTSSPAGQTPIEQMNEARSDSREVEKLVLEVVVDADEPGRCAEQVPNAQLSGSCPLLALVQDEGLTISKVLRPDSNPPATR